MVSLKTENSNEISSKEEQNAFGEFDSLSDSAAPLPLVDSCPGPVADSLTDSSVPSSCASCPMQDCPTRGMAERERLAMLEAEKDCQLTPAQMTVLSLSIFIFPLLSALAGTFIGEIFHFASFSNETISALGALAGFFSGLLIVQLSLKLVRFRNGK